MALQVRVRHTLGERLVDLADRPVERPLVVGRSREADLKIPSVTVANTHCALFVHDRQWVLQDTSGGATFVNRAPIDGPTPLCIGDEIMLGSDASPAIIEVDPAGVAQGRSGHPAETHDVVPAPVSRATMVAPQVPAAPARRAPARSYAGSAPSAPPAMQYAAPPPPALDGWNAQPAAQDDPFAGWGGPAAASTDAGATPIRRRKKSNSVSPAAIAGGVAVCVGLIFGVVFFVIHQTSTPPVVVKVAAPSSAAKDEPSGDLFDMRGVSSPHSARPSPAAAPTPTVTRPPKPQTPDPTDSAPTPPTADPNASSRTDTTPPPAPSAHKDKDAWESVEAAFAGPKPGEAIVKSEDYRRQHPTESYKDLDEMIDAAMDQLWWRRVGTLCGEYKTKADQIKAKERDIREETSAAFKKDLLAEKKTLDDELAKIQMHLTADMAYTGTEVPPIDNKEVMARLREERDKEKFGAWKISTLRYTKSHRGAMPWDS
jgi:hypothetical protein